MFMFIVCAYKKTSRCNRKIWFSQKMSLCF